jgi:putative hydrolase of the HAD superfamily
MRPGNVWRAEKMIKALLFDINGTIIDILTDESRDEIYRTISNLLDYQGVRISPEEFRGVFWEQNRKQRRESGEEYPEFNAAAIFDLIIRKYATARTLSIPYSKLKELPVFMAQAFRAASRLKLEPYPGVRETLDALSKKYRMAAVSDGQTVWAVPELGSAGLSGYFESVVVSGSFGFRKPDPRMFQMALDALELTPAEVIFVGNDMHRDVFGAGRLGIKTVFFKSNQGDQKPHGVEADYIIYDFSQLPEAVRFLEPR